MKITAKQSFSHGPQYYRRGEALDVSDATGQALIKAGLAMADEQKSAKPVKSAAKKAAKRATKTAGTSTTGSAANESASKTADTGADASEADGAAGT